MRFTKRALDALNYERKSGAQCHWDDEISGFGLRIYPSGRKAWVVRYRAKGKQRNLTLGKYTELTLKQARDMAREKLVQVRQGEDPSAKRQAYHAAPTLTDLRDRYMAEHAIPNKKPTSVTSDELLWRLHILPTMGDRKVVDVERAEIVDLHRSKADKLHTANRMLALLSMAFNLAEMWGWRPDGSNPTRHVKRFKEAQRERYLSTEELGRLADALELAERARTEMPEVIAAFRLLLFTGCRKGEIRKLRWAEVDFERRCLRLEDSKTGAKVVQLNSAALEVLAGLERVEGNPYVLPGKKPGRPITNLKDPWARLTEAAGIDGLRIHDLRHNFASIGAGAGLSLPTIGHLLGHTQMSTTARYAHLAPDPVKEATERIGQELAAAMAQREPGRLYQIEDHRRS